MNHASSAAVSLKARTMCCSCVAYNIYGYENIRVYARPQEHDTSSLPPPVPWNSALPGPVSECQRIRSQIRGSQPPHQQSWWSEEEFPRLRPLLWFHAWLFILSACSLSPVFTSPLLSPSYLPLYSLTLFHCD